MELYERPCPMCKRSDASIVFRSENFDPNRLTAAAFSSRKLPEYMSFRLMRCRRCDLVYASPVPAPDALTHAYEEASFEAATESVFAAKTYVQTLARARGLVPVPALDIGAADGAFLRELLAAGFSELVGYEPSAAPVATALADVRPFLRQAPFDGAAVAPESYGLVTCFQTIEHVYEPLELVTDIYRILRPGGTAFLVGHDVEALSARLLGAKSPIFDIEHMQLLNRRSAALLMRHAGFADVRVSSISNVYPLSYWVKLFPLPDRIKGAVLRFLARTGIGGTTVALPAGNLAIVATKGR